MVNLDNTKFSHRDTSITDISVIDRLASDFLASSIIHTPALIKYGSPAAHVALTLISRLGKSDFKSITLKYEENIIGYLYGYQVGNEAHLENIYISPIYRSVGQGQIIGVVFINWARNKNLIKVIVEYDTANIGSREFYIEKLHFNESMTVSKNFLFRKVLELDI